MAATNSPPVEFYTPKQVAEMFQTTSEWWVREGVRRGRWTCVRGPRQTMRFSREHVQQIAAVLERETQQRDTPTLSTVVDVSVFGATARSARRNQRRAS